MKSENETNDLLKKLDQGLTELFDSENYKNYLDTMSKFHNYSFNNTLLIALQNPGATHVASYTDWKNKFHRQVMKGEKAIRIIAPAPYKKEIVKEVKNGLTGEIEKEKSEIVIPAYKAVSVFDISQTEGNELPVIGVDELKGDVGNYEELKDILKNLSPVVVLYDDISSGVKGFYDLTEKKIVIKNGLEQMQEIKTLVHEIAHALLHDKDGSLVDNVTQDIEWNRRTKEVQAESVAYTVCQHLGIDTSEYSFGYIAGWSSGREKKELKNSMETIRKTVNHLIGGIEKEQMSRLKVLEEKEIKIEERLTKMDCNKKFHIHM